VIRSLKASSLPRPRFLYTPVVQAGPWIVFSGMIGLDPASGKLVDGGAGPQTRQILANLGGAMRELSLTADALVSARIFTTRFGEFGLINEAWDEWLGQTARPPARTSVGVSALPLGAIVEMEFSFYEDSSP